VHPCKIYNILAIGAPFLYIGPAQSHMGDIIARIGDQNGAVDAKHGESDRVARLIVDRADEFRRERNPLATASGSLAASPLAKEFSQAALLPRLVAHVEALCADVTEEKIERSANKLQSVVR
jgi:colanic acid biosynthesis glycosyl transferase WcaI